MAVPQFRASIRRSSKGGPAKNDDEICSVTGSLRDEVDSKGSVRARFRGGRGNGWLAAALANPFVPCEAFEVRKANTGPSTSQ